MSHPEGPVMLNRIADGRTDLVFELVSQGHAAATADAGGTSMLRWCAYYGDVSAIRFLLSHGESLDSLGANRGLCDAAYHGHWRLCEFLIENGADSNHAQEDTGETALHAALCKANRPAYGLVVQVLLANGADPNRATKPGVETAAFMRDCRTKGETALHRAAAFADEATVVRLLDAGARIDSRDMHGETPLNWASWHARPDAILRRLCYGRFSIHPDRHSAADHGHGFGALDTHLLGKPRG